MQLLEGSKDEIDRMMIRIKQDPRHQHIDILEEGYVYQRQFPDWSMAFLNFESQEVKSITGYSRFLEHMPSVKEIVSSPAPSIQLLHHFKSIMAMSEDAVIALAESIQFNPLNLNGSGT